jgi:hypothetical protein
VPKLTKTHWAKIKAIELSIKVCANSNVLTNVYMKSLGNILKDAGYKITRQYKYGTFYIYSGIGRITFTWTYLNPPSHHYFNITLHAYDTNTNKWQYITSIRSQYLHSAMEAGIGKLKFYAATSLPKRLTKVPVSSEMPSPRTFKPGGTATVKRYIGRNWGGRNAKGWWKEYNGEIAGAAACGLFMIKEEKVTSGVKRIRVVLHDGSPDIEPWVLVLCRPIDTYAGEFAILYHPTKKVFHAIKPHNGVLSLVQERKTRRTDTNRLTENDHALIKQTVEQYLTDPDPPDCPF